jgi:hypothetical protein
MRSRHALVLVSLALAGCATLPPQLKSYPNIDQQILSYYNGQNVDEGGDCPVAQMRNVAALKVLKDTAKQVVVSAQYYFQTIDYDPHGNIGCEGSDTRVFTFAKDGGRLTLTRMGPPLNY